MKLGFIGLGSWVRPWRAICVPPGTTCSSTHAQPGAAGLRDAGAVACASPEVAQRADVIFTMVPDTPDVEKVLFAENGVAAGCRKGRPWST